MLAILVVSTSYSIPHLLALLTSLPCSLFEIHHQMDRLAVVLQTSNHLRSGRCGKSMLHEIPVKRQCTCGLWWWWIRWWVWCWRSGIGRSWRGRGGCMRKTWMTSSNSSSIRGLEVRVNLKSLFLIASAAGGATTATNSPTNSKNPAQLVRCSI